MMLFHEPLRPVASKSRSMRHHPRPLSAAAALIVAAALFLPACSGNGNPNQASAQLQFGVDMARRGLWSEAMFRFQEAARLDPQSPHVLNNLAVASEALGQFDQALEYYKKALQIAPNDREARANYSRFAEFYQSFKAPKSKGPAQAKGTAAQAGAAPAAGQPPAESPPDAAGPPQMPLTPPGQAPIEPPTPPTGNVATPPSDEPPPSPRPPGGSPAIR